jgi:hypothetical protein
VKATSAMTLMRGTFSSAIPKTRQRGLDVGARGVFALYGITASAIEAVR